MDETRRKERQAAREQVVAALQAGQSWHTVSQKPDLPLKRAMAYRLLRAVRQQGKSALQDGRHGHPSKLRGEARVFLEARCRETPSPSSSALQQALHERFGLHVSVSQINRVRAALGVSHRPERFPQEKKRKHSLVARPPQNG